MMNPSDPFRTRIPMKSARPLLSLALATVAVFGVIHLVAAQTTATPRSEYATIRWDGKDNTHVIRPGGQVEFVESELRKAQKPAHADDRAYYMNLVMNGLSKEGYEFAGMSSDEIVMRRPVGR